MTFRHFLEIFDSLKWRKAAPLQVPPNLFKVRFVIGGDKLYVYLAREVKPGTWEVEFYRETNTAQWLHNTGESDEFDVAAAVWRITQEFINKHKPEMFFFDSAGSRVRLYRKMISRLPGYEFGGFMKSRDGDDLLTVRRKVTATDSTGLPAATSGAPS